MILLACFAALGFAAGFALRLPAFAALLLLAVVGYAVFSASVEGVLVLAFHAVVVGIAGQIGYFVAIVAQAALRSRSKLITFVRTARLAGKSMKIRMRKDDRSDVEP